jgi:hypothetical protein
MQQVLEEALEQYRRQQFLEALNAAYATMQADPQLHTEATEELALWDTTLLDGIENLGEANES